MVSAPFLSCVCKALFPLVSSCWSGSWQLVCQRLFTELNFCKVCQTKGFWDNTWHGFVNLLKVNVTEPHVCLQLCPSGTVRGAEYSFSQHYSVWPKHSANYIAQWFTKQLWFDAVLLSVNQYLVKNWTRPHPAPPTVLRFLRVVKHENKTAVWFCLSSLFLWSLKIIYFSSIKCSFSLDVWGL